MGVQAAASRQTSSYCCNHANYLAPQPQMYLSCQGRKGVFFTPNRMHYKRSLQGGFQWRRRAPHNSHCTILFRATCNGPLRCRVRVIYGEWKIEEGARPARFWPRHLHTAESMRRTCWASRLHATTWPYQAPQLTFALLDLLTEHYRSPHYSCQLLQCIAESDQVYRYKVPL